MTPPRLQTPGRQVAPDVKTQGMQMKRRLAKMTKDGVQGGTRSGLSHVLITLGSRSAWTRYCCNMCQMVPVASPGCCWWWCCGGCGGCGCGGGSGCACAGCCCTGCCSCLCLLEGEAGAALDLCLTLLSNRPHLWRWLVGKNRCRRHARNVQAEAAGAGNQAVPSAAQAHRVTRHHL